MVHAGKDRRHYQVGVGIRATGAVLDVAGLGGTRRNAQADRAVVDAPGGRDRRIGIAAEAAVGVGVGREDQHRFSHRRLEAAQRMHQQLVLQRVFGGEQVVALFIGQRNMDVHARSRPFRIGLGHEGGGQPMLFGAGLDQALQHHALVTGIQHVGAVAQHDLHLARRIFRDQGLGGQVLNLAPGVEVLEERREIVRVLKIIGLVVLRAVLVDERLRRHGLARHGRRAVHEEELEFDRADRRHVQFLLEPCDDAFQRVARIGIMRRAVEIVNGGSILRGLFHPRHAHEGAGDRPHQHVAVAFVEDQAGLGNVLSGHVEDKRRDRHEAAVLPGGNDFVAAQHLAARHAAEVGPDHLHGVDIGIGIEERLGFSLAAGNYKSHGSVLRLSPSIPSGNGRDLRPAE